MQVTAQTDGGNTTLTITLTGEEMAALGRDAWELTNRLGSLLYGLALLRARRVPDERDRPITLDDLDLVITDAEQLIAYTTGIRDAAIRAHVDLDGSYGRLAVALRVSRSTAQSRRDTLTGSEPSKDEQWARDGGPRRLDGARLIDLTPEQRRENPQNGARPVTPTQTMTRQELTDALRAGADGADMRAAVEMLVGYNDGDLLDEPEIRRCIATGTPTRLRWTTLYNLLIDHGSPLADTLGDTAYNAAQLACALTRSIPLPNLSRTLDQFDKQNSQVALRAFAIALGLQDTHGQQAREIDRLNHTISRLREACQTDDQPTSDGQHGRAAYMRLDADEPVDQHGQHAAPPALAIPVADVLDILGAGKPAPAAMAIDGGELDERHLAEQIKAVLRRNHPMPMIPATIREDLADRGITVEHSALADVLGAMLVNGAVNVGHLGAYTASDETLRENA